MRVLCRKCGKITPACAIMDSRGECRCRDCYEPPPAATPDLMRHVQGLYGQKKTVVNSRALALKRDYDRVWVVIGRERALGAGCPRELKAKPGVADNNGMEKSTPGSSWLVKRKGESVTILGADASVVAELPRKDGGPGALIPQAYVIAAAPQLLEICTKVKSVLENNLVVTSDGFKIDCTDLTESLQAIILRARGFRKSTDEP